ncbi:hypothetical protein SAMN05445756_0858 [Kytococcus aerolatus]|uniref:Uncharacterized protein n=1 Tax=Kytococcus aerolatus TaxID=592308 RepID=A0A212TBJ9_9MICO|nr:hypothetical protein SAMN05445756_0858 [Kytococcus aerolatus]
MGWAALGRRAAALHARHVERTTEPGVDHVWHGAVAERRLEARIHPAPPRDPSAGAAALTAPEAQDRVEVLLDGAHVATEPFTDNTEKVTLGRTALAGAGWDVDAEGSLALEVISTKVPLVRPRAVREVHVIRRDRDPARRSRVALHAPSGSRAEQRAAFRSRRPRTGAVRDFVVVAGPKLLLLLLGLLTLVAPNLLGWLMNPLRPLLDWVADRLRPVTEWIGRLLQPLLDAVAAVARWIGAALGWLWGLVEAVLSFLFGWVDDIPWPRIDLPDVPWPDLSWLRDLLRPVEPVVVWLFDNEQLVVAVLLGLWAARAGLRRHREGTAGADAEAARLRARLAADLRELVARREAEEAARSAGPDPARPAAVAADEVRVHDADRLHEREAGGRPHEGEPAPLELPG